MGSEPMGARGGVWGGVFKAMYEEAGRMHQAASAMPWVLRRQTSVLGKRNTGFLAPRRQRFSSFIIPVLCWGCTTAFLSIHLLMDI